MRAAPGILFAAVLLGRSVPGASAQTVLEAGVASTAGGVTQSGPFALTSVLGQPSPPARVGGARLELLSGFLYAASPEAAAVVLAHAPPGQAASGQELPVSATVRAGEGVAGVRLHYRAGGDAGFAVVPMERAGEVYHARIPAGAVGAQGIAYFFTASDSLARSARLPASGVFSARVSIPDPGLTTPPLPGGTDVSAYRLLSLPIEAADKGAGAVLEDDLGPYDPARWRLFALGSDQQYLEFPDAGLLLPGRGFWLIVEEPGRRFDTGPGLTQGLERPFPIPLQPRWNLIGNPFNFPVAAHRLRASSGQPLEPRAFLGAWNDPVADRVEELSPFEGYAVFNQLPRVDTLLVDPDVGGEAASKHVRAVSPAFDLSWVLRISARSGAARDVDNVLGAAPGASPGADPLDLPEPPVVGDYVSLYFSHPEWETLAAAYSTDIRAEPGRGEVWRFEVRTRNHDRVELSFEGVSGVPAEYQVWLVDEALGVSVDVRAHPAYTVAGLQGEPRRLKLLVGSEEFVADDLGGARVPPAGFELAQNFPNPFQSSTTVRFGQPADAPVTAAVYTLLGGHVVTLVQDEMRPAGRHAVVWDGLDAARAPVASGMYLLRLSIGGRILTQKMLLVR